MARNLASGVLVPVETVWRLSQAWYGTRLDPAYRGRSPAEAEAVFASVGLTGAFWRA